MRARLQERWRGVGVVSLLTVFAVAVHGYHPFAEDGGLYVAGIRKLLDPGLYPKWSGFVTEHLRFSVFAPMVAGMVRVSHLRLETVLLAVYVASVWATLYGGWMLAARVTDRVRGQCGAVALLACWLTLPIAGTSLMLMDPYVTARSVSTPLVLMAMAWALDATAGSRHGLMLCVGALALAALMHPLMAGYGVGMVLLIGWVRLVPPRQRRRWAALPLAISFALAAAVYWKAPAESAAYVRVELTRYYWFSFEWQWYEQLGLVAPLAVLVWMRHVRKGSAWDDVAESAVQVGLIAMMVAVFFCHGSFAKHLVARMQPLRSFQMVYEVMILLLGAWLGERVLKQAAWRWTALLAGVGGVMFYAQQQTYPNSDHVEWPWAQPSNCWEQAFLWVRDNTPKDALFALDAHYITLGWHEDAQNFRPIAERSAVADYSKDGGEAAIMPGLTADWVKGQAAQSELELESDWLREARLRPLGVTWVVLQRSSATGWSCPYANPLVKVCRLP